MPSIIRTLDGQVECGRGVVWWRGSGQEQEKQKQRLDVAGISSEALGVWFRFREMMAGSGSVQGLPGRGWWVRGGSCVRARPAAAQPVVLPSPPASVACECVRACRRTRDTSQVRSGLWTAALMNGWVAWTPGWAAGLATGYGSGYQISSGSGLEPQRPNQTID